MECELSSDLRNKLNGDSILTEFNDRRRFVWKKKRERESEGNERLYFKQNHLLKQINQ